MASITEFKNGNLLSDVQKRLLDVLKNNGPMTREEIITATGYPRTTIYDNLTALKPLVKKYSRPTNTRGRPIVLFNLIDQ
jgi:predicted ArsR family transcriptional regulator